MQTHQIKNHMMSLTVAEHGAEITSIQLEGIERMWDADPAFWGRTAPVLFPIVGALKDNSYRYEGQTYLMGQHGFARDMDFTLTDQTEDKLEFTLFDNEETYEKYPFHFQLQIIYEVFQNQCRVTWKVKNMDDKTMYFQIGGHPAFACPCEGGMIRDDYSAPENLRFWKWHFWKMDFLATKKNFIPMNLYWKRILLHVMRLFCKMRRSDVWNLSIICPIR